MLRAVEQDQLNWQVFFATLLQPLKVDYEVRIGDTYVDVWVAEQYAEIVQAHFRKIFSSSGNFHANLPFERPDAAVSSSDPITEAEPLPEASIETYKSIFKNLFSAEALKNVRLLNWDELLKDAFIKEGVLYLTPFDSDPFIIAMLQNGLERLLQSFDGRNVTLEMVRAAVKGEKPLPASKINPVNGHQTVLSKGLIQDCFGVQILKSETPDRADQAVVFFDIKTLWNMLFPPTVMQEKRENYAIFPFLKHELLLYVRQLLNDGVLLRVYQSNEPNKLLAQPLFLSGSPGVEKPRLHVLLVDRSSSLSPFWSDLKKNVISFIDELRKTDPNATVRIVFFETNIGPTAEFTISEKTTIDAFINECPLGGGTLLFGAIQDELQSLVDRSKTKTHVVSMVLFTDGVNNERKEKYTSDSLREILRLFGTDKLPPIHFFPIGFGNCDTATLVNLASDACSLYTHLTSVEDLRSVLGSLDTMAIEQLFKRFAYSVANHKAAFTVPVCKRDGFAAPSLLIPFERGQPLTLEVDGNPVVVIVPKTTPVPEATNADKMNEIQVQAATLLMDEKVDIAEQIAGLQSLQQDLGQTVSGNRVETESKIALHEVLGTQIHNLQIARQSSPGILERLRASIASAARRAGLFSGPNSQARASQFSTNLSERTMESLREDVLRLQ